MLQRFSSNALVQATQSSQASAHSLVRLSEALREGEAQLRERARRALASADQGYAVLLL